MDIKRRKITYDVAHGGNYNSEFEDKGVLYHKAGNGIDASAQNITDAGLTYDDEKKELTAENVQVDNELNVDGETTLNDKTTINADLDVNGDAVISGNLHIKGDSYEEHATDLFVGSDLITLRDGAETQLTKDARSGVIINNYDGSDSLGILGDNTGTLRVGEYNTSKVYTTDGSSFYSDFELTQPVDLGDKKRWKFGEQDGVQIWYAVDKDDTRAVATRADAMGDGQLTCWSEDTCSIESIQDRPFMSGALLSYCEPTDRYYWSAGPNNNSQVPYVNEDGLQWSQYTNTDGSLMVYNHGQIEYFEPCGGAVDRVLMSCNNELKWGCPDGIWCRGTVRKIESGDSNCLICWCPDSDGTVHLPNMITNITLNGTTYTTPKPGVAVNLGNVVRSVTINGNTQTVGTSGNVSFTVNASVAICGQAPDNSYIVFTCNCNLYCRTGYWIDEDGLNVSGLYVISGNKPAKICNNLCVLCCSWFNSSSYWPGQNGASTTQIQGDWGIHTYHHALSGVFHFDKPADDHQWILAPACNMTIWAPKLFFKTNKQPPNWQGNWLTACYECRDCNFIWQQCQQGASGLSCYSNCSWNAITINQDLLIQWGAWFYSTGNASIYFPIYYFDSGSVPAVFINKYQCSFTCNGSGGFDNSPGISNVTYYCFKVDKPGTDGFTWLAIGRR